MLIAESQDTLAPGDRGVPGPEKENVSQAVVLETPLTLQTCRAHKLIV